MAVAYIYIHTSNEQPCPRDLEYPDSHLNHIQKHRLGYNRTKERRLISFETDGLHVIRFAVPALRQPCVSGDRQYLGVREEPCGGDWQGGGEMLACLLAWPEEAVRSRVALRAS